MAGKWCRKHCPVRDFQLQHDRPSDFVHSVLCASPIPYAVMMTVLSVYTFSMALYSGITSVYREKIFIWLTYWAYFSLTARFLLTAWNSWSHVRFQRRARRRRGKSHQVTAAGIETSVDRNGALPVKKKAPDFPAAAPGEEICEMPVLYKVQWVLQNVTSCAAIIVTGLYWVVMYTPNKPESVRSINSHVLNSILVLVDLLVSRAPIRLQHFIFSLVYILMYAVFTIIYWTAGGTNHEGQSYIYSLLDYSGRPGRAMAVVLGVALLGTPLMQALLYLLFRLRVWVQNRCVMRKGKVPQASSGSSSGTDVKVSTTSLGGRSENSSGSRRPCSRQEKGFSLGDSSEENLQDFSHGGGRDYTLTSNRDAGDTVIDVDMDFEMDEILRSAPASAVATGGGGAGTRPPLHTECSEVSCTDSTRALLT